MAVDSRLVAWVGEAMEPVGVVTSRAMMGGATLYLDGTVFAIVAADALWFKADRVSDAAWDDAGASGSATRGATAESERRTTAARQTAHDDVEALRGWARLGAAGRG